MKDIPKSALDFIVSLIPKNPERALSALLPKLRFIELAPVAAPTVAQIKFVRTLDPYSNTSISEIKRQIQAGTIKLGPYHRGFGSGTMKRQLEKLGLVVTSRSLSDAELSERGLTSELPDYLKEK